MKAMNAQVKNSAPLKLIMLAALFSSRSQTVPAPERCIRMRITCEVDVARPQVHR